MKSADLLARALGNDQNAAAALWKRIADGLCEEAIATAWLQHVAVKVVQEVIDAPPDVAANRRAERARAALGLSGALDKNWQLTDDIETLGLSDQTPAKLAKWLSQIDDYGLTEEQLYDALKHRLKKLK